MHFINKVHCRYLRIIIIIIISALAHIQLSLNLKPHGLYVAHQALLTMEYFRQQYWSGLPFPPPGHLPNPGIELEFPVSPALQAESLSAELLGKPILNIIKLRFRISLIIIQDHLPVPSRAGVLIQVFAV